MSDGALGLFALVITMSLLNTVLFNTVLGDKDWLANGLLFAHYHLHVP